MSEKRTLWAELRGCLKGRTNGRVFTIKEMNEAIADAGTEAGMAGITPGGQADEEPNPSDLAQASRRSSKP
jgi:hypothetical protein